MPGPERTHRPLSAVTVPVATAEGVAGVVGVVGSLLPLDTES